MCTVIQLSRRWSKFQNPTSNRWSVRCCLGQCRLVCKSWTTLKKKTSGWMRGRRGGWGWEFWWSSWRWKRQRAGCCLGTVTDIRKTKCYICCGGSVESKGNGWGGCIGRRGSWCVGRSRGWLNGWWMGCFSGIMVVWWCSSSCCRLRPAWCCFKWSIRTWGALWETFYWQS